MSNDIASNNFGEAMRNLSNSLKRTVKNTTDGLAMTFTFPSNHVAERLHALASKGVNLETSLVAVKLENGYNISDDELFKFMDFVNSI